MHSNLGNKIILMIVFLVSVHFSFSQKKEWEPSYMNISVKDGLPSSETYFVHQDRQGYMWFCTDHGVVKYDGFRSHLYNKSNGLPDEVVFKIYEDEIGRVWFYLYNGSLAYYDPQKRKILPYKYNHLLSKLNHGDFNARKSFMVDKHDNVYYSGVYQLGRIDRNGKLYRYKLGAIKELLEIKDEWLYRGVKNPDGLKRQRIRLIPENGKPFYFTYYSIVGYFDILELNGHQFLCLDKWVYDIRNPSKKAEFADYTGMYDVDGELWVTTLTGAYRFKNPEQADLNKPDGIYQKDQKVTSVAKDSEGGYWFSTLDKGIYYTPCLDIINWTPEEKESKGAIHDINGVGNNVYYSSAFGYFNLKTGEKLLGVVGAKNVMGIWDNKLVISTNKQLYPNKSAAVKKWGFEIPQFQGWAIDKNDNFFAAYIIPYMVHKKGKVYERLLSMDQIYDRNKYSAHHFKSLAFDEDGELYAGSLIGLFRMSKGRVEKCKLPGDLDRVRITDLKYHKNWGLIAATRGKGLILLKNGNVIGKIQLKDGLLSNQLNAIYIDKKGNIYVASNKGISKIVHLENHKIQIFNLTELNGLSSAEVSAVFRNNDGVYIGTREGITLIPSSYKWAKTSHEKQIRIQSVFANGKQVVNFKNGMEFNASHRIIRFLLQTTNYKSQHRQPYRYRFRKTDPWSVGFNGELIMINPAFEAYRLEIQYRNEYGSWSKPYVLTNFSILPPFYSTWWFTALIVLVILTISFLFFRNRIKVIQHRNAMQAEIKLLEQKALLAQMNPHFIFNSLNSIQSFLIFNENDLAERYLLKLSQLIRMTLINSRESEISIEKEIDVLKKYIELEQMRFKNRFDFEVNVSLSHADQQRSIPPMLIQPFVENAILHGFKELRDGGKLKLNLESVSNDVLHVEIVDNGLGYGAGKKETVQDHKSYGTQIISERLNLFREKYQAEFHFTIETVLDEKGNSMGTKVNVSIPILRKKSK
ncbi:Sensor histidine kinase YehU [compost metagenome]